MKKIVVALICGVLLVGCGNSEVDNAPEENTVATETQQETVESDTSEDETVEETTTEETVESVDLSKTLDITGCDTFTQIVDRVLEPGMGYTNEQIGEEDVLLVCSKSYDNMDGNMAGIDATIYVYKDAAPVCLGSVASNGTAYPLAVKDGLLYTGIYHGVATYTIKGGELIQSESAWIEYDKDGNETYYYSVDGKDAEEVETADSLEKLEEEYADAKVLNFDVITE